MLTSEVKFFTIMQSTLLLVWRAYLKQTNRVKSSMRKRLNWGDSQLLPYIVVFLNTQTWQLKSGMDQDASDSVPVGIRDAVEAISGRCVKPWKLKVLVFLLVRMRLKMLPSTLGRISTSASSLINQFGIVSIAVLIIKGRLMSYIFANSYLVFRLLLHKWKGRFLHWSKSRQIHKNKRKENNFDGHYGSSTGRATTTWKIQGWCCATELRLAGCKTTCPNQGIRKRYRARTRATAAKEHSQSSTGCLMLADWDEWQNPLSDTDIITPSTSSEHSDTDSDCGCNWGVLLLDSTDKT